MDNILIVAGVPQKYWGDCYISNDGKIFTPRLQKNGTMDVTGGQVYSEWAAFQNKDIAAAQ